MSEVAFGQKSNWRWMGLFFLVSYLLADFVVSIIRRADLLSVEGLYLIYTIIKVLLIVLALISFSIAIIKTSKNELRFFDFVAGIYCAFCFVSLMISIGMVLLIQRSIDTFPLVSLTIQYSVPAVLYLIMAIAFSWKARWTFVPVLICLGVIVSIQVLASISSGSISNNTSKTTISQTTTDNEPSQNAVSNVQVSRSTISPIILLFWRVFTLIPLVALLAYAIFRRRTLSPGSMRPQATPV